MARKKKQSIVPSLSDVIGWTVCLILFLVMITALKGAFVLHMEFGRTAFGSSNSSLALLAAGVTTWLWGKTMCCRLGACKEK
jgi:hypothetical protein|tara:strand:+ start:153 stop:398 length:246 start_codon:yes stop_codon:yes gene_type:complete